MSIETLKNTLPDYAKDIRLNLSSLMAAEAPLDLSHTQRDGIVLAAALATGNQTVIQAMLSEVRSRLSEQAIQAAYAAAAIMAMNNVYYRFVHLISDRAFAAMPAGLRMNVIASPGISRADFELNCLAVSVINGCGMCIDAHTDTLMESGTSRQAIQATARLAAVLNAVACVISASSVQGENRHEVQ